MLKDPFDCPDMIKVPVCEDNRLQLKITAESLFGFTYNHVG